tara:strand:+ start:1837 stop:3276 length:1440 start_codon:yes stop_codon:yes gene_type:complete
MINELIIPVILCGGSGTRLWPLSRESYPKQFLPLISEKNKSLLQSTLERLKGLKNKSDPILICNEEHRFIVAEQMREIEVNPYSILLEPFGRNTAPAITIAALKSIEKEKNPILLILSADHEIKEINKFIEALNYGTDFARENKLVNFGVIPKSPETGYGYIKAENPLQKDKIKGEKIIDFTEKPSLEKAIEFTKDKRYSWNSGIFMFRAKTIISEIKRNNPTIISQCQEAIFKSNLDLDFQRLNSDAFNKCPNISIDVLVMEKTNNAIVIPLDVCWSDIGSWQALWENSDKDINGNFIKGKTLIESSRNCYLRSENRLLVGIGLENLIAIETHDAILVADKEKSQEIKKVVEKLKKSKITEGERHSKIFRPWGYYLTLVEDHNWQVKLISVKPGEKLSLQIHNFRSEHWIVVKGLATVEINGEISTLKENESTYIPLGSKHRLSNKTDKSLSIIEVQSGSYVGEDDIIRFEDKYGRLE